MLDRLAAAGALPAARLALLWDLPFIALYAAVLGGLLAWLAPPGVRRAPRLAAVAAAAALDLLEDLLLLRVLAARLQDPHASPAAPAALACAAAAAKLILVALALLWALRWWRTELDGPPPASFAAWRAEVTRWLRDLGEALRPIWFHVLFVAGVCLALVHVSQAQDVIRRVAEEAATDGAWPALALAACSLFLGWCSWYWARLLLTVRFRSEKTLEEERPRWFLAWVPRLLALAVLAGVAAALWTGTFDGAGPGPLAAGRRAGRRLAAVAAGAGGAGVPARPPALHGAGPAAPLGGARPRPGGLGKPAGARPDLHRRPPPGAARRPRGPAAARHLARRRHQPGGGGGPRRRLRPLAGRHGGAPLQRLLHPAGGGGLDPGRQRPVGAGPLARLPAVPLAGGAGAGLQPLERQPPPRLRAGGRSARRSGRAAAPRPVIEARLAAWLERIHRDHPGEARHRIYLVAAEGGGIRAAYWTAAVLGRLERESRGAFSERLFAVSAVSGGSLGAAVFAAQLADGTPPALAEEQARAFLGADHLSPVLGSLALPRGGAEAPAGAGLPRPRPRPGAELGGGLGPAPPAKRAAGGWPRRSSGPSPPRPAGGSCRCSCSTPPGWRPAPA